MILTAWSIRVTARCTSAPYAWSGAEERAQDAYIQVAAWRVLERHRMPTMSANNPRKWCIFCILTSM